MEVFDSSRADELAALLAVARAGSFIGAGRILQRHATIISRRIAVLEARLGVRLIERTTRQITLTEAGEKLVARVQSAADTISAAEQEASASAKELRGRLRLSFPESFGRMWLAPMLPTFLKRYPALKVEVDYNDQYIDLVANGFDVAVRIGVLKDSNLIAKKLCEHRRVLAAAPSYIEKYNLPLDPSELATRNCLVFPNISKTYEWSFSNGVQTKTVTVQGTLQSNDSLALLDAARHGVGILYAGEWLLSRDFSDGTLIPILPEWSSGQPGGIFLVRPSAKFAPARTKAFIEWIVEKLESQVPWKK